MGEMEKERLEKAKNGDIEAFESLIASFQKMVFNIAYRMIGNVEDASELSQEVFLRVYQSIHKFKEGSSLSTWIYRITSNLCIDWLRKSNKFKMISLDEEITLQEGQVTRQVEDRNPKPDEIAEKNETSRLIHASIGQLSEEHRIVIILRDIQGWGYEEIAQALQCPVGTVKSRINRGRQMLREFLKEHKELFNQETV